jgi:hypothetical protein
MSLYIHAENQRLLWNTIQQVPQFQQINHINKEVWFSNIIKQFYQTVQYLPQLSPQDLQQLNRQTVSYMVNELKKMTQPFTLATDNFAGSLYAKPKYAEAQQTIHAYSSRQNDYEMMSKPKVPPVADFSEKFDDETKSMSRTICPAAALWPARRLRRAGAGLTGSKALSTLAMDGGCY